MKHIFLQLRTYRKQQGLSQQALAAKAGLSLATIQNIETGRSNPEWQTLNSLFKILGLQFELHPNAPDWDQLAGFGCPLMSEAVINERTITRENLISLLQQWATHLEGIGEDTREHAAFYAFLAAIKDHYPSVWLKLNSAIKTWSLKQKAPVSVKLRRLALQRLGTYL